MVIQAVQPIPARNETGSAGPIESIRASIGSAITKVSTPNVTTASVPKRRRAAETNSAARIEPIPKTPSIRPKENSVPCIWSRTTAGNND